MSSTGAHWNPHLRTPSLSTPRQIYPAPGYLAGFLDDRPVLSAITIVLAIFGTFSVFVAFDWFTRRHRRAEARLAAFEKVKGEVERESLQQQSVFAGLVAHELRTPASSIAGAVDLLRAGALAQREGALVDIVAGAAAQILGLIEDLVSTQEGARDEPPLRFRQSPGAADPRRDVVEAAWAAVRVGKRLAEKAVALEMRLEVAEAVPAAATVDAARARQALANVLSNAIQFTPRGGAVVMSADFLPDGDGQGGGVLRVAVRDTGRGIAPEALQSIFTPFQRVRASMDVERGGGGGGGGAEALGRSLRGLNKRASDRGGGAEEEDAADSQAGAGLGLVVTRDVAQSLGGDLTVESPGVGKGCTATVTMRLGPPGAAAAAGARTSDGGRRPRASFFGSIAQGLRRTSQALLASAATLHRTSSTASNGPARRRKGGEGGSSTGDLGGGDSSGREGGRLRRGGGRWNSAGEELKEPASVFGGAACADAGGAGADLESGGEAKGAGRERRTSADALLLHSFAPLADPKLHPRPGAGAAAGRGRLPTVQSLGLDGWARYGDCKEGGGRQGGDDDPPAAAPGEAPSGVLSGSHCSDPPTSATAGPMGGDSGGSDGSGGRGATQRNHDQERGARPPSSAYILPEEGARGSQEGSTLSAAALFGTCVSDEEEPQQQGHARATSSDKHGLSPSPRRSGGDPAADPAPTAGAQQGSGATSDVQQAAALSASPPPPPAAPASPPAAEVRVIVAEDDALCRKMLAMLLRQAGLSATLCPSGLGVTEILEVDPSAADGLILDSNMGGGELDGYPTLLRVRRLFGALGRPPPRVAVLSGEVYNEDMRARFLAAGADRVLVKPASLKLMRELRELFAGGREEGGGAQAPPQAPKPQKAEGGAAPAAGQEQQLLAEAAPLPLPPPAV